MALNTAFLDQRDLSQWFCCLYFDGDVGIKLVNIGI